jgi:hypothetical protein
MTALTVRSVSTTMGFRTHAMTWKAVAPREFFHTTHMLSEPMPDRILSSWNSTLASSTQG